MKQIAIEVSRDRDATFEPQLIPKRTRDVSGIKDKVLSMYAKGISQRDIIATIEDIYGFDISAVSIKKEYDTKNYAVYSILGYDVNGVEDILGIWLNESKHNWMRIFDELKTRGVEDILFISMDGVSGLEEGAKLIFKNVVVQRSIVHLIRNSIKYILSKCYKKYTAQLKKAYGAINIELIVKRVFFKITHKQMRFSHRFFF